MPGRICILSLPSPAISELPERKLMSSSCSMKALPPADIYNSDGLQKSTSLASRSVTIKCFSQGGDIGAQYKYNRKCLIAPNEVIVLQLREFGRSSPGRTSGLLKKGSVATDGCRFILLISECFCQILLGQIFGVICLELRRSVSLDLSWSRDVEETFLCIARPVSLVKVDGTLLELEA